MAIDYVALRTELETDSNSYGYREWIDNGTDWALADLLNKVRAGISVPRRDVTPMEVIEAIKVTDFISNATALYASWFESLTQFASIRILKDNGTDTRVMTNLMTLLVNGSQSEVRLRALASRAGSRAEQLFGVGTSVSWQDVARAFGRGVTGA
jgi:hypothetical protein